MGNGEWVMASGCPRVPRVPMSMGGGCPRGPSLLSNLDLMGVF